MTTVAAIRAPAASVARTRSPRRSLLSPAWVAIAVMAGTAGVLATSPLGSGDYGQWLMAARPWLGEDVPAYRASTAVPPVVPFLIAAIGRVVGDGTAMIHVAAVAVLIALAAAIYVATRTLFRSGLAAAVAVVAAFLLTDQVFELFAFGGLLQAGSLVWLLLAVAAYGSLARDVRRASRRSVLVRSVAGAGAVLLGALTHVGTTSILMPTALGLAALAWWGAGPGSTGGTGRISRRALVAAPIALAVGVAGVVWLLVFLPGGTELAQNPASLGYRGPDRLLQAVADSWTAIALLVLAAAGVVLGTIAELRRRRVGPWTVLAGWSLVTIGVVGVSVATAASTDYPRFATPLLMPACVAAGGAGAWLIARSSDLIRRRAPRPIQASRRAVSVGVIGAAVLATTPFTVASFAEQVHGYALTDPASLDQLAAWVRADVPPGTTILAPVRDAKWLEGLSGRDTLFTSAIRYSFRPVEWDRSLAAASVYRSQLALVNPFFFARFTDGNPTASAPRGLTLGVNHAGEYVDLLRTIAIESGVVDATGQPIARLSNLTNGSVTSATTDATAATDLRWATQRAGGAVNVRETVSVADSGSTLTYALQASGSGTTGTGLQLTLRPVDIPLASSSIDGSAATLTFNRYGATSPQVRLVAGGGTTLTIDGDGTIHASSTGGSLGLVVTDLTGSPVSTVAPAILDPSAVIDRYHVSTVVLEQDHLFAPRSARLVALGFTRAAAFGPYVAFTRSMSPAADR